MDNQKEWVFIAKDNRPYFYKDGWLHWWHPDKKWVTHKKISDLQAVGMIKNLSLYAQSLYFKESEYKPDWYTEIIDTQCKWKNHQVHSYVYCRVCGRMKNDKTKHKPCKGTPGIRPFGKKHCYYCETAKKSEYFDGFSFCPECGKELKN